MTGPVLDALVRQNPSLAGIQVADAWGGVIDTTPDALPAISASTARGRNAIFSARCRPNRLDQTVTGEPVMNTPDQPVTRPASASGLVRRIAAAVIMSGLVFLLLLWLMAFSVVTSLLIAAGCCVVVVAASTASDPVVTVLDAIAAVVFGVLGAIAAFLGVIFSLFGS